MVPKSDIERFIQAIIDDSDAPSEAKCRIEQYLTDILEERVSTLEPAFRIEYYLAKISGANVELPEPMSRADLYLAALAGEEVTLPDTPNSSLEEYLARWCETGNAVSAITGAPASFTGRTNTQIQALSVNLRPVQDLHGYDNQWPGGGRKNKYLVKDGSRTSPDGLTITGDGNATIKVSGTSSEDAWYEAYISGGKFMLPAGTYTISARLTGTVPTPASGNTVRIGIFNNYVNVSANNPTRSATFTISEPTEFFATGWFCAGTFDCTVQMQLEEGSIMTSWTPYSNICPITGWTGANVTRTGKNLLPSGGAFDVTVNGIRFVSDGNGTYTINGTATAIAMYEFNIQEITLPSNVYIHMLNNASTYNVAIVFLNGPTQITAPTPVPVNAIKDLSTQLGGKTINKLRLYVANGYTANITISPMLCIDNTPTAYEPYQGTTYPVTWQTEAGTVYGGTVDVTTGVLTVDRAIVDLGTKSWAPSTLAGYTRFWTTITGIAQISAPNIVAPMLCSNYPTKTANQTYQGTTGVSLQQNSTQIYIYDPQTESMTGDEFKSAMSGVQLCYELATPVTYQLTPQEVKSLLGVNNIWSDSGDVTVTLKGGFTD